MGSPAAGAMHMTDRSDEELKCLRARARARLEEGTLPRAKAVRTWGGLGTGQPCALCDTPIDSHEPEFELQVDLSAPASQAVRFHRECHAIWDTVRGESSWAQWIPVAQRLPAPDELVEARVSLAENRTVVLNLLWVKDEASGAHIWVNSTTMAPLPEGWLPSAWRPCVAGPIDSHGPAESAGATGASVPRRA